MTDPTPGEVQSRVEQHSGEQTPSTTRRVRWKVFWGVATLWLLFIALGQVRARYWIQNEFQIEWRSITGVWRVALGELPGGTAIQALVLVSAAVIVCGVIGCLYLILIKSDDAEDPALELP